MRQIVYNVTGGPDVLHLVERDVQSPAVGEVRVRIVVSGVNPTDWKSRRGAKDGDALPFAEVVPNQDGAGVIDAIGDGVTEFAVGDRVWLMLAAWQRASGGTAQEFTLVPVNRVRHLADDVSFELGASLGVPAVTAHRALTVSEDGPSRLAPGALAGKTVLVAGGAGAVGHAAIQLAKWAGATVITTISSEAKALLARAAGAHHVINYREGGAAAAIRAVSPDGVDLVVEVNPVQNAELNLAVIANRGSIAVYSNNGGDSLTLDIRRHFALNIRYQFLLLYTVGQGALDAAAEDITLALLDGALPIGEAAGLPLHHFTLEQTADAHAAVENDIVGKVLIMVGNE
jgi:NADPH2:quinone reductase